MQTDTKPLQDWLNEKSGPNWYAYVKRLSANDTGATGGHQAGVYVPKPVMDKAFPSIQTTDVHNPDYLFNAQVESHGLEVQELRAIYYNSKRSQNKKDGRDEQRITRWNTGVDYTPVQDHENTGALAIFAFYILGEEADVDSLSVWVCENLDQEDYIEGLIGEVAPATTLYKPAAELFGGIVQLPLFQAEPVALPDAWALEFPSGSEIVDFVVKHYPFEGDSPDVRLLKRREKEYAVFRAVEDMHVLDHIKQGFGDVESFIALANSISNRRKSRSGRSLELHLEHIFREEDLTSFDTQAKTEGNKKPDFLFPGEACYHDSLFPSEKLNMLAVKTTLKDRWRQILNEADKIPEKYLFTLQEGISLNQYEEIVGSNVSLVVPEVNRKKFPKEFRHDLLGLGEFITKLKSI